GVSIRGQARGFDLETLYGRVDVAHGAAGRALLAHHVPGLERVAQLHFDAAGGELSVLGKTELEMRREPLVLKRVSGRVLFGDDVGEILLDEIREHEAVVQLGAP